MKYPNIFEKLVVCFIEFISLLVKELSSIPIAKPAKVISRADNLIISGIVIVIDVIGGMLIVTKNPAKMLPIANRIIGLIKFGLFSLIGEIEEKRGLPSRA